MKLKSGRTYDDKCYELAVHFFGPGDPRLAEIAQDIQDAVEQYPERHDHSKDREGEPTKENF